MTHGRGRIESTRPFFLQRITLQNKKWNTRLSLVDKSGQKKYNTTHTAYFKLETK